MTATVVSFDGTDTSAAKTQLETLAPTTSGVTVFWTVGQRTYVAYIL